MKKKSFSYYKVTKYNSFKEMLDIAVREAGDRINIKYKETNNKIVEVTYSQFQQG